MPLYKADELAKLLEERKSILTIGPQFSGKTQSLWTLVDYLKAHNLGPLYHFDLDIKADSLIMMLQEKKLLDNYVLIRLAAQARIRSGVRKTDDNRKPWEEFQHEFNKFDDQIDIKTGNWKDTFSCGAVFIDSLTTYNDMVMEYVAATLGHDFGEKGTDARNDYTKVMNKVKSTIKTLKSFPCITGWIAHHMIVRSEFDGKVILLPNMSGKDTLAPAISKEFNMVLVSGTQKNTQGKLEYVWQVKPEGWVISAGYPTTNLELPTFIPQDYRRIL